MVSRSVILTISPANRDHAPAAASGQTIGVTANVAWTATRPGAQSRITITGGSSGSGNGTVTYSVAANTGETRTGTITVSGNTPTSIVFWDHNARRYWWTAPGYYPYLYRYSDGATLWYQQNSVNPRWFYNMTTRQWESWK